MASKNDLAVLATQTSPAAVSDVLAKMGYTYQHAIEEFARSIGLSRDELPF